MRRLLKGLLCATLVLAYIPSYETCDNFWRRWRKEPCGLQEVCLSGTSAGVEQSWKQNVLDCNEKAPDKAVFRCGNISHQITSLITKNCKYSNFDMKAILHGRNPAVVYLDYTKSKIIPVEITFSKMRSLEMVFIKGSRTGGPFQITFYSPNTVQTLDIDNHDFSKFVQRPFINLTVLNRMAITKGTINRLTNNFFSGLERLKDLSLHANQVAEIESLAFKNLISLVYLDLSKNRLAAIHDSTFDTVASLEEIDLSYNPLRRLPESQPFGFSKTLSVITIAYGKLIEVPNIDWSKHNLASVDLTGNNITRAVLPIFTKNRTDVNLNSNNIKTIELNFTRISDVSPVYSIFYNEPVCDCMLEAFLEFLHSSRNKLHTLFPGMDVVMCAAPNSSRTLANVWPNSIFCEQKGCPAKCACVRLEQGKVEVNCSSRGLHQAPKTLPFTTITVYLRHNNISTLSTIAPSSWSAVTSLYLTNNKMKTLDGWTVPSNLTTLALDENNLSTLPKFVTKAIDRSKEFRIYLAKNKWTCDCTSADAINWMQQNSKKIADYETITCRKYVDGKWTAPQVGDVDVEKICPTIGLYTTAPSPLFTTVGYVTSTTPTTGADNVLICSLLSVLAVLILCILFCLLLHRRSLLAKLYGRKLRSADEQEKGFDAFVCYNDDDRKVANAIVGRLEPQYRVFLHDRNLLSSEESSKKILYSMRESKAILLIISNSLIRSRWFQVEFRKIYRKIPEKYKRKIIPIFLEDVISENFLPHSFRQLWYLKSRLRWEENFFWEKLLYLLRE